MLQGAREQIGHGGERNVRVRPYIDSIARGELGRSQVIEKYERTDHLPIRGGQHPPHHKTAQIAFA